MSTNVILGFLVSCQKDGFFTQIKTSDTCQRVHSLSQSIENWLVGFELEFFVEGTHSVDSAEKVLHFLFSSFESRKRTPNSQLLNSTVVSKNLTRFPPTPFF